MPAKKRPSARLFADAASASAAVGQACWGRKSCGEDLQGKATLSPRLFFNVLGRAAAEGSGGFGRCLQIAPSSSLPGVVACVCACGRAACLRTCFPCSPCVRTYGACVPAHVPAPVARTHARLYVRTYVHCMRAHSREGEKAPSQYVRTYARTCAYVRACPRRSLLHAVCARTYARTQFLWAPAPPPPSAKGDGAS